MIMPISPEDGLLFFGGIVVALGIGLFTNLFVNSYYFNLQCDLKNKKVQYKDLKLTKNWKFFLSLLLLIGFIYFILFLLAGGLLPYSAGSNNPNNPGFNYYNQSNITVISSDNCCCSSIWINPFFTLIGVIIGGLTAYLGSTKIYEYQQKRRKNQISQMFLVDLNILKKFIDELKKYDITSSNIIEMKSDTILLRSQVNLEKEIELNRILETVPYFRIAQEAPLISSLQLYVSEIYSLNNSDLIQDLLNINHFMTGAYNCLLNFKLVTKPEQIKKYQCFLRNIERITPYIEKILMNGDLEGFS